MTRGSWWDYHDDFIDAYLFDPADGPDVRRIVRYNHDAEFHGRVWSAAAMCLALYAIAGHVNPWSATWPVLSSS